MSVTITSGSTVIVPDLVLAHQDEIVGGSIIHEIIGRTDPDITLRPASAPSGTLRLFFLRWNDAQTARNAHLEAALFSVSSDSQPWLPARYVMRRLSRIQQESATKRWVLEVEYTEVPA